MNKTISNIILLIIRILVGGMLVWSSYIKLTNMEQVIPTFEMYFGLGAGITWAVAIGELLTGLGIFFGIWTKGASAAATIIMVGAVYYSRGDVFAIILLIGSIILLLTGSGKIAAIPCAPLIGNKTNPFA